MGLVSLKCPECGAELDIDDSREYAFCSYCGSKVMREKTRIELSGSVSVKGIAGADSLLQRAFIFLEDGDFSSAGQYIERVLDLEPQCAKAYIGRFMVENGLRDIEEIGTIDLYAGNSSDFKRALEFSSGEEHAYYQRLAERNGELHKKKQDSYYAARNEILRKMDYLNRMRFILILVIVVSVAAFFVLAVAFASPAPEIVQIFSRIFFFTAIISGIILGFKAKKRTALVIEMSRIDYELNKLNLERMQN